MASRENIAGHPIKRDPTRRTVFGEFGCAVYAWPSKGGVIIRVNADIVELKQLGFDPLSPPEKRQLDTEKEDAFCMELRKIGGKWWPSEQRFLDVWFKDWDESQPDEEELIVNWFGWPQEGGLLVLEFKNMEVPDDMGRLRMATTMEERCRIMKEKFNAKFFEDLKSYASFQDLL